MKKKLAIFDMDGTLFDTCRANYEAYQAAITDLKIMSAVSREQFQTECFGKNYRQFLPEVYDIRNDKTIKAIHDIKIQKYEEYCDKYVKINHHLFQYIKATRDEYYNAIVSTATKKSIEMLLNKFGVYEYFDLIVSQEDVVQLKPSPDGYLDAIEFFGVECENTIIFEDSDDCIKTAKQIGCSVLKIEKM